MLVVLIRDMLVVVLCDKARALSTVPSQPQRPAIAASDVSLSNFCTRLNGKTSDYAVTNYLCYSFFDLGLACKSFRPYALALL